MNFAPICPTAFLETLKIEEKSRYHMALAQVCLRDAKYYSFYKDLLEEGHTVILDNGAYEREQLSCQNLLKLANEMRPTVVVAPDSPHRMEETLRRSTEFCDHYSGEVMIVLHASPGDLAGFVRLYRKAAELADWIGFSRLTWNYGLQEHNLHRQDPLRRAKFALFLHEAGLWEPNVKHHALGFGQSVYDDAALEELSQLHNLGFEGCDSSAPIWRGLQGVKFGQPWHNAVFDPNYDVVLNLNLAKQNLEEVLRACRLK